MTSVNIYPFLVVYKKILKQIQLNKIKYKLSKQFQLKWMDNDWISNACEGAFRSRMMTKATAAKLFLYKQGVKSDWTRSKEK